MSSSVCAVTQLEKADRFRIRPWHILICPEPMIIDSIVADGSFAIQELDLECRRLKLQGLKVSSAPAGTLFVLVEHQETNISCASTGARHHFIRVLTEDGILGWINVLRSLRVEKLE